jgi:hypothetical protein
MPDNNLPAGIGHNNPPLEELLTEETASINKRNAALLGSADRCIVTDDETAGRATTLAKMLKEQIKAVDSAREDRKRPFLDAGRTVDSFFKALSQPLDVAARKVVDQIDAYRREQQRKADAERRRLEEEARKQREAAEAADRARREAEAQAAREAAEAARRILEAEEAAQRSANAEAIERARAKRAELERAEAQRREAALAAELDARRQQEDADTAARAAAAVENTVITSDYGVKASGRKVKVYAVTDPAKLGLWLLKTNPAALAEALLKIAEPIAKGMKLPAGSTAIPGMEITETTQTVIR